MSDNDCGNQYSIKAVAVATGLSVETLRAWERRYAIVEPKRDASGHRVYSGSDVARLRRLREATDRGHPIGKIARLSDAELNSLLIARQEDNPNAAAAQTLAARILAAIEKYDLAECDQTIAMAFALLSVPDVISEVLSPVLREVGERWHRGEFSVGQERLVSSSVRRQISGLLNTYNTMARGAPIVFATITGEPHELGILMFAALAASRKLRTCYLGADLPPEEISNFATRVNASAVAISMVLPENAEVGLEKLAILRQGLPDNIEIWIGGAASFYVDPAQFPAGSVHMAGRKDFENRLDLLAAAEA
jgi:DNA-binding transcriptional MerR regulator/predicted component of type VI protein secretion system